MSIEDRVRHSLVRTADGVEPPMINITDLRGDAVRRRRRNRALSMSAAVAAIALAGYGYALGLGPDHPNSSNPTGDPTDVHQTTNEDAALNPGRYWVSVRGVPLRASVAIGDGWNRSSSQIFSDSATIQFWTIDTLYEDACHKWSGAIRLPSHSVADVALALDRQAATDLSTPQTVQVGGYPGVRAALTPSPGVEPSRCTWQSLYLWNVLDSGNRVDRYTTRAEMLWILDAHRTTIVVDAQFELRDTAETAAIAKIIDSIRIAPSR
jgi:hypothetical protein